ncbi:MAG: hypothetical protein IJ462_00790 [Clostridia bacterium]|nr:hypothetical protein [Clostridia bacterium]
MIKQIYKNFLLISKVLVIMCLVLLISGCDSSESTVPYWANEENGETNEDELATPENTIDESQLLEEVGTDGFEQLYYGSTIKWLDISNYDVLKGVVYSYKNGLQDYACRIFENGYCFFDWRYYDGTPKNSGTKPVGYTVVNNDNITFSDGTSMNIMERKKIQGNTVYHVIYYRVNKGPVDRWYVDYGSIDWDRGTTQDEEKIYYYLKYNYD